VRSLTRCVLTPTRNAGLPTMVFIPAAKDKAALVRVPAAC
jgi:hypothetical protein